MIILTDEEIHNTTGYVELPSMYRFARAIEAAVIAKIGEPVAWWIKDAEQFSIPDKPGYRPFAKAWKPLYQLPEES
jgi:hypothetical protein